MNDARFPAPRLPRRLSALLFTPLGILLAAAISEARASEPLSVYYPTTLSAKDRQNAIKAEGFSATVFAQFRDFIEQVKAGSPETVIAPSTFGKFHQGYKPVLQFLENGATQIKYLVLSLNESWNPKNLSNAKIGAIEEVERANLSALLKDILDTHFKLVRSVTKPEDLFPLMVFKSADVILVSPTNYESLKKTFTVKVHVVATSTPVNGPMLFVKEGADAKEVLQKLKAIPKSTLSVLGFSGVNEIGAGK